MINQYCPLPTQSIPLYKAKLGKIMNKILLFLLLNVFSISILYGQSSQSIRGVVYDKQSNIPIEYVTVVVLNTKRPLGVITDSLGEFKIPNVPIGRHDLQLTSIGYEPIIIKEVMVSSSKELFLEIQMTENTNLLSEIVVTPQVNKAQPLNNMALGSARMLSVEEASRYAGGFDDPARLATSFAGVTSSVGNNGIVVRGNAPKFLQWRMEDVEIPNPNHFAEVTTFGGGGLSALSSFVLGNSDFMTGAFPAEYSNALSGVFDMNLRTGNNQKRENMVQLGLIGIDVASEGPFKQGSSSSYIFNYRYSTLGLLSSLLPDDAENTKYQDLSFKLNFPTRNSGTFSVWGVGLIDRSGQNAETDVDKWEYMQDKEDQDVKQYMGAVGLNHKIRVWNNAMLKTTLATTVNGLDMHTERMNANVQPIPQNVIKSTNYNFVFASSLNKKYSKIHTNKTGIRATGLQYDLLLKEATNHQPMNTITDESGFSSLLSAYTNSSLQLSDKWILNLGVSTQLFTLNNNYTIEPRAALSWRFKPNQSLALSYGLHSRLEMLSYYFAKSKEGELINKNMDFTKAHHIVLSYDLNIGNNYHVKIEPYLQQLYNVPIISDSTFSFINLQNDWFITDKLSNRGKGINYGIDITFEKYMSQGYYYMLTASLFNSKYKTNTNKWYNTRYNRNYVFNALAGKEWMVGRSKQNVFNANIRFTYQGGDRYSPIDLLESQKEEDAIYYENDAFSKQLSPALLFHFTVSYKINKKKLSHEFAIKVLNATNYKDYNGHRYNFKTHSVDPEREAVMIPNVSYKVEF